MIPYAYRERHIPNGLNFDPATAMMATMAVSSGVGAVNKVQEGNAKAQAFEKKARDFEYMERLHVIEGKDKQREEELKVVALAGRQESDYVGGGVAKSGTVLQVLQDTVSRGAYQASKARFSGNLAAYNDRVGAADARYEGRLAKRAGTMGAVMGVLSTGMNIAGMNMNTSGTGSTLGGKANWGEGGELGPGINTVKYKGSF